MTISKYDIQPLFATPYFRADVGHAISNDQIEFISNLKMIKNRDNYISENLYIFEEPELKSIAKVIQEALDIYANKVLGIPQKIYVTQSWSLVNQSNVGMHSHAHSNSFVSGVLYYAELPTPASRVIFDRDLMYQRIKLAPDADKANLYNTQTNVITPKSKEVLLFPSDINHAVEPNLSNEPRRVVSFNCFIKGKFGDFRDVSELHL
ncbi:MAG: hypothetical protein ACI808_003368 [Paraglaciecola sp.]|jgi:uncharacterized protein (TIGR02466 family)